MKISIIISVVHMALGVFVKAISSFYYKKKVELWFKATHYLIDFCSFKIVLYRFLDNFQIA